MGLKSKIARAVLGFGPAQKKTASEIVKQLFQHLSVTKVLASKPIVVEGQTISSVLGHPVLGELEFTSGLAMRFVGKQPITLKLIDAETGEERTLTDVVDAYFMMLDRTEVNLGLLLYDIYLNVLRETGNHERAVTELLINMFALLVDYVRKSEPIIERVARIYELAQKGDVESIRKEIEALYSVLPTRFSWAYQLATSKTLTLYDGTTDEGYVLDQPIKFLLAQAWPGGSQPQFGPNPRAGLFAVTIYPKNELTRTVLDPNKLETADDFVRLLLRQIFPG